jgi:hypothetical protein
VSVRNGTAILESPKGERTSEHVARLAPCRLPAVPGAPLLEDNPHAEENPPAEPPLDPPAWPAAAVPEPSGRIFATRQQRANDAAARLLHGRVVMKRFPVPGSKPRKYQ